MYKIILSALLKIYVFVFKVEEIEKALNAGVRLKAVANLVLMGERANRLAGSKKGNKGNTTQACNIQ